jgi:F-type H+-transporting ATPase subunit epsilon
MADKAFKLEIVTPRKVVYNGDVVSFSAPGTMGGFQVLHNHAPLLAEIGVGEVKLQDPQGNELHYATSGGFVDVKQNHVVLLAETVEHSTEIDKARAEASRDRAQKRLAEHAPELNALRAQASLHRAVNRLKVARNG